MIEKIQDVTISLATADRTPTSVSVVLSGILAAAVVALAFGATTPFSRSLILRVILLLAASGETMGAVAQALFSQEFLVRERSHYRVEDHGPLQDFGFYNGGIALGLLLAAVDPLRNGIVINVVIALYFVHGAAHLLRYAGVLSGGAPDSTRDLRQGLLLLPPVLGLLLFHP